MTESRFTLAGPITYKRLKEFSEFLDNREHNDINILLTSHGGDEGIGRAIAGIIRSLGDKGVKVTVTGYGDIQSAATLILASGTVRKLSHAATVMLHESSSTADSNASGFKKLARQMESDEAFWCGLLERYTGTEAKVWSKLHEAETYLRPEECLKLNLIQEIV